MNTALKLLAVVILGATATWLALYAILPGEPTPAVDAEVGVAEYKNIIGAIYVAPFMRGPIAHCMQDGVITQSEYVALERYYEECVEELRKQAEAQVENET